MLFEHSTPVFIIISHEMPKVFQNYIYLQLSTSIYDLVLLHVCHFHHQHHPTFWKFIDYRDTRAFILDPCIQEFLQNKSVIFR